MGNTALAEIYSKRSVTDGDKQKIITTNAGTNTLRHNILQKQVFETQTMKRGTNIISQGLDRTREYPLDSSADYIADI